MAITPQQARAELARRELARRQQAAQPEENLFQKVLRLGIKDPAIGVLNMGREFANLPNKLSGGYFNEWSPSDYNFGEALGVENPSSADEAIQMVAQYAPAFALPGAQLGRAGKAIESIPKIGRFAAPAVSQAIPQAIYSASQAPTNAIKSGAEAGAVMAPFGALGELMKSTNPMVRNIAKGLTGVGSAYLGREAVKGVGGSETFADIAALAAGALGARGFGTQKEMKRKLTEGVSPKVASERLGAAERLRLDYLTPAEAGVSPWAAKRQGALGRTEEGGQMLYERGEKRRASEREAIERTLNKIYSSDLEPVIQGAYEQLKPLNLPTEFPMEYQHNAIINAAEKRVKNRPAYQESLKKYLPENVELQPGQTGIEPTSLIYWDHVKRALYDMEKEATRKGSGGEANIIGEARRGLVDHMDSTFPQYAEARALYERKKVREGLEKVFDQKQVNGSNFYRALASEKKFDELMGSLRNVPEAQQNLRDMRLLFNDLMSPPTIKTAKGKEEYGMNQSRSSGAFLESLLEHVFTKGGGDKAAIEFITSKDWANQLHEINKISDKQMKLIALSMALSKGVSQAAGRSD